MAEDKNVITEGQDTAEGTTGKENINQEAGKDPSGSQTSGGVNKGEQSPSTPVPNGQGKGDSSATQTPQVPSNVKKPSGTMEALRTKHRHIDGRTDENYEVRSQPDGAYNTSKPLSDRTARTADEIAKAYMEKYFKDWKNESNLTLDTSLRVYTYEKDKGANITTQRLLGDILERALREKYNKIGFKNDERAKSVIALLYSLTEVKGIKNISYSAKNKVIQAIFEVHKDLMPKAEATK